VGPVVEASGSSVCTRTKLAWALITCAPGGARSAGAARAAQQRPRLLCADTLLCQAPQSALAAPAGAAKRTGQLAHAVRVALHLCLRTAAGHEAGRPPRAPVRTRRRRRALRAWPRQCLPTRRAPRAGAPRAELARAAHARCMPAPGARPARALRHPPRSHPCAPTSWTVCQFSRTAPHRPPSGHAKPYAWPTRNT